MFHFFICRFNPDKSPTALESWIYIQLFLIHSCILAISLFNNLLQDCKKKKKKPIILNEELTIFLYHAEYCAIFPISVHH